MCINDLSQRLPRFLATKLQFVGVGEMIPLAVDIAVEVRVDAIVHWSATKEY